MASTAPSIKIVKDEDSVDLRAHYGVVAQHALRILWQRKWLIAATVVAGLAIAVIALTQIGPSYTSEALIQVNLNFNPDTGTKSHSTASVNAAEVVDSTARIIRSRATADAVVVRLGLDRDPRFERQPLLSRWLSAVRSALGFQQIALTPRDLAVDALMRKVRVTPEPRSYLISVAVAAGDPEVAAKLTNAVAVEYLRSQTLKELAEERSAVEHDLADASLVYGPRHPTYLRASARLEQLDARVAALRAASSTSDLSNLATGHSLIAAHKVMNPSGPSIPAILTLAILAGLSLGIGLARYTPIGFSRPALTAGVQILLFVAYALGEGIFAIVKAGREARRSVLLVRLWRLIMGFAGSAGSWRGVARYMPIGFVRPALAASAQIVLFLAYALGKGIFAFVTAGREARPSGLLIRPWRLIMGLAGSVGSGRHAGWRPLLRGTLFCLAIAGFVSLPEDALSSLVDGVVQRIAVFRMPDLGAWIAPARDHLFAGMADHLPSAADGEPRAESGIRSAASAAAETPAIPSAAEPVPVPVPKPIAPTPALPPATERTATVPSVDHIPSAVDGEPRAENGFPSAASAAAETPAIPSAAGPVQVPRPVQAAALTATAPVIHVPEPKPPTSILTVPADTERILAKPSPGPGLSAEDRATLVARGEALVGARDIASARLYYERAAEMGDGRAALRMGMTFDPVFLERAGIRGTKADQQEAISWYRRARDLGDTEADRLLKIIEPH